MNHYEKSIIPRIEAKLDSFTKSELRIAEYFIRKCRPEDDLSARFVAKKLKVSEASLTRFAKKCGFRGYRTFTYSYSPPLAKTKKDQHIIPVLDSYQELLNKTYSILDIPQIHRVTDLISEKGRQVIIIGKGCSGMTAFEMQFRYKRIGLNCEAITDEDNMRISAVLANAQSIIIGISLSGTTPPILNTLKQARAEGATTILFTANNDASFHDFCDEVVLVAKRNQLELGKVISPQFPVLIVMDILYADIMQRHTQEREHLWDKTYQALKSY